MVGCTSVYRIEVADFPEKAEARESASAISSLISPPSNQLRDLYSPFLNLHRFQDSFQTKLSASIQPQRLKHTSVLLHSSLPLKSCDATVSGQRLSSNLSVQVSVPLIHPIRGQAAILSPLSPRSALPRMELYYMRLGLAYVVVGPMLSTSRASPLCRIARYAMADQ